jgi:type I restriction enzyme S subunit
MTQPIPVGYKQTEIGVIPDDWEAKPLGELVEIFSGDSPSKFVFSTEGTPYFKVEQLNNGSVYADTTPYFIQSSKKVLAGSVIFPKRGASILSNKIRVLKYDSFMDTNLMALTCHHSLDELFLYNQLTYRGLDSVADTTSIPQINNKHISPYLVPFPRKTEQTAIANALSDVDALISEQEKLIAKKQAIKTATMQQLLTGKTRLPQFAHHPDGTPKRTQQTELGEIPEDWDAIKMGDLAKIQRGASPRPIDSPVWFDRNSTVGWLRISDVTKTSKYLTETTQSFSELGIANSRFVPENNLIMSICATVGKPIITKKDLCIHDGFVVFNGLSVNQDFMYYLLKELEDEWSKQGQTGSQMNLNTDLINGTFVAVPKEATEQTAIAQILSDMDEEIQTLEQRLTKTRQIKQGMMQQLLTGKIRFVKGVQ